MMSRMRMIESTFKASDGTELFYRAWLPEHMQHAILLFHRGHEHSARWSETVSSLQLENTAYFAWDQRGHGKSPGDRGHAPSLSTVIRDADDFARHVCREHGVNLEETAVVAHSVGAVIAAGWIHDYAPRVRALVLGTPALRVKLYVPLAIPALRLKEKFFGPGIVKSYVKSRVLTHDPAEASAYDSDAAIFREISVKILLDLFDTSTRLLDDAGAITTPTLILAASNDWVVQLSAQQLFYKRLGSSIKQFELLKGFYHAIFHELDRRLAVEKTRAFLLDCFARPVDRSPLLHADRGGPTRTEYDLLRCPSTPIWSLVRLGLKIGSNFSDGLRLGWNAGFDSGVMLDYIYQNQARGITPIGRIIDRNYLNAVGWAGIRIRRAHLQSLLRNAMEETHRAGKPVRLLDIAAGPGRYVIESMQALAGAVPASAVLRDYRQQNLDAARRIAEELRVTDIKFVVGDAFDLESLASTQPRPTIAIASGIYELFPKNECVLRSLRGLADALEENGTLIYTCQPWHPQVEFIARALTNREGQPWIMRRRSQAEMDELVRAAGFEKTAQLIDEFGIFTVSVARKAGR